VVRRDEDWHHRWGRSRGRNGRRRRRNRDRADLDDAHRARLDELAIASHHDDHSVGADPGDHDAVHTGAGVDARTGAFTHDYADHSPTAATHDDHGPADHDHHGPGRGRRRWGRVLAGTVALQLDVMPTMGAFSRMPPMEP
jgi:hypothetical protein